MGIAFKCLDALVAVIILGLLGLAASRLAPRDERAGLMRTVDGDTLELAGRRLRLVGIDAPEADQQCGAPARTWPCGQVAREGLKALTAGITVRCEIQGRDKWGRGARRLPRRRGRSRGGPRPVGPRGRRRAL